MNGSTLGSIMQNAFIMKIIVKMIVILVIFIATVFLSKLTKRFVQKRIDKASIDITQLNFMKHVLSGAIYFFGVILIIFQIDYLKTTAVSILASSGIVAVIIGFASQQTFANIVSGLFITLFKPFRIGDRIRFIDKDVLGVVEDITLRHTVLRTIENKHIIIPNNVINNEFIENANIIEEKICTYFNVRISYDSDIDHAIHIIKEEVTGHHDFYDIRSQEEIHEGAEPVEVKVVGIGETSINIRAWVWAKDSQTGFNMNCDLIKSVKERFDQEGIEIPYPYRTLVFKDNNKQIKVNP
ncbi:MAG: Small-conductance mechanosensitive channel [Candidatus Dichloromethanomonas elyunquensis]|nr:MAG: Small-conductance mechanosensitive channel [Candidatus Dichloromethanomonas elyunquensis]